MGEVDVAGMLSRMSSGQFTEWAAYLSTTETRRTQRKPVRAKEPKVTVAKTPSEIYRTIKDGLRLGGHLK